ncbi:MAG: hypothetical protein WCJ35_02345 [Planctomycetota bacterium]
MATKKELGRDSKGRYFRNLGWKKTPKGYAQQKFYLGRDDSKAKLANLRLEQLWQQITRQWEREAGPLLAGEKNQPAPGFVSQGREGVAGQPQRTTVIGGVTSVGVRHGDLWGDRPVWDEVTLAIADAIRNGDPVARVPLLPGLELLAPESPIVWEWLDQLRNNITGIRIELKDEVGQRVSEQQIQQHGHRLVEKGRRMLLKSAMGQTLHVAIDAFSRWVETKFIDIETKKLTQWGSTQTRIATFLKRHLPNCAIQELDAQRVEDLLDIVKNRPPTEEGNPISVAWAKSCIKLFRSFLRWLNRTPEFDWKRPADLETMQIRIPLTAQEKSNQVRSAQVDTYNPAELKTLWEYASPFQRLLMLLALNGGFGRAEVASLGIHEILLRQKHPHEQELGCNSTDEDSWIFRVRQKTGVYGEFKLWPETAKAIEWWLRQRAMIEVSDKANTLLVTKKGLRYDATTKGNHPNFQIPNGWYAITKRIREDKEEYGNFRQLSFNKLRKTAGNLIRKEADGEVAGVFLCHGTPVKTDDLLDNYTNRPFAKLFEALDRLEVKLRPIWESVLEPFPEKPPKGGPNISRGTIQKIQSMRRRGYKLRFIAAKVGVSVETVRRWGKRSEKTKPADGE